MWFVLTRKPAVIAGVAVVPIELRGDWSDVPHQQEDEARSCHFSTGERFACCHFQKVSIAHHIPELGLKKKVDFKKKTEFISKLYVKKQCSPSFPQLLYALTSIKVVQPFLPKSPNPFYPGRFLAQSLLLAQNLYYSTPFNWGHPLSSSFHPTPCFYPSKSHFSPPVYLFPGFSRVIGCDPVPLVCKEWKIQHLGG